MTSFPNALSSVDNPIARYVANSHVTFCGTPFVAIIPPTPSRTDIPGTWPTWEMESYTRTRLVPGSKRVVTQVIGYGPYEVVYTCLFGSLPEYAAFEANLQKSGDLVLEDGVTHLVGVYEEAAGKRYNRLSNVLLAGLADPDVGPGGWVIVDATFQRSVS